VRTSRVEAFSDGVLAIIITIMVLDLRVPEGESGLASLHAVWPKFVSYVLSFIYIGIYWNNHHHLLHVTRRVNGTVLWSNLHLLFWLSLVPFATSWVGENHFAPAPMALYGFILLMAAIAYYVLQMTLKSADGPQSLLASALGTDLKGKMSPVLYLIAIAVAFVRPAISGAIYVLVALIWLVPDRRIERVIAARHESLG
jgi:uncharacterized membrane protein